MTIFQEKVYPVRKTKKNYDKKRESKFSNGVFQVVKKIPAGKFLTYKIVAKLAGRPKAWRAVGNILNRNKDRQIPCHRVVKSNRRVGGYRFGRERKIALLKKEGVIIKNGKITF